MIAVILVSYGQISILQKNTNNLQANNSNLSDQVAALKAEKTSLLNQTAALEKDNANLQQQVASQETNISSLTHDVAILQAQVTALKSQLVQRARALLSAKAFEFVNSTVASIHSVSCVPN